jgi:hypothetical protein
MENLELGSKGFHLDHGEQFLLSGVRGGCLRNEASSLDGTPNPVKR